MNWPPKDWRALIALLGSIGAAVALTLFLWWLSFELLPGSQEWTRETEPHRAETLRWVAWIAVGTISLVIIGLGFAVNRRSFKGQLGKDGAKFDFEGGEGEVATKLEIPDPTFGKDKP